MQSSQLELHTPTSKKALPPLGQIRMVNVGIQWCGKWQRYPCCISSRPWAWLPKLTLRQPRVKDVHNSRLRLGFQNRYRLPNEYSTTGRYKFPMIRMRKEENVCQSYWRRLTSAKLFFLWRFHAVFAAWASYADLQESPSSSRPNPHGERWDPMVWKVTALSLLHLLETLSLTSQAHSPPTASQGRPQLSPATRLPKSLSPPKWVQYNGKV